MKNFHSVTVATVFLMSVLFPVMSALAHDFKDGSSHDGPQTTAKEAYDSNTEEAMRDFLLHAHRHVSQLTTDPSSGVLTVPSNELSVLYKEMREEGVWRYKSVYLIELNSDGLVSNHGKYFKSLHLRLIHEIRPVRSLVNSVLAKFNEEKRGVETLSCEQYDAPEGMTRWACAVNVEFANLDTGFILIAGLDHDVNDPAILNILRCDDPSLLKFPEVIASQVYESQNKEDMKEFVREAIRLSGDYILQVGESMEEARRKRLSSLCLTVEGPWNHRSVYLFVLSVEGPDPVVVLNGNNPELTGTLFEKILDEDDKDVSALILDAAGEDGKGGFVEYKWDDPDIEGDEVNEAGRSPGTSPKISYVEGARIGGPDSPIYIFGSGIYPKMAGSDSGCAIAGEGSDSRRGGMVNLLLVVFSLSFAFCLRNRSGSKKNSC